MPFLSGRLHIGPINLTVCSCLIYLHLLGQLVTFKHRMRKVYGNLVNIIGLKKILQNTVSTGSGRFLAAKKENPVPARKY